MTTIPPSTPSASTPSASTPPPQVDHPELEGSALLYRRDHILSDLTLERYLLNELSDQEIEIVERVIDHSPDQLKRLNAMKRNALQAAQIRVPDHLMTLTAHSAHHKVRDDHAISKLLKNLSSIWTRSPSQVFGLILAFGLLAAVIPWSDLMNPPDPLHPPWSVDPLDPSSGIRLKGTTISWEVYVHDGTQSRALHNESVVYPKNRLGFRVGARVDGFVMIIGRDQSGEVYQCAPQAQSNAISIKASDKLFTLKEAVELDDLLGREELFLIFCDQNFSFDEIENWVSSFQSNQSNTPPSHLKKQTKNLEIVRGHQCKVRTMSLKKRALNSPPNDPNR